MSKVRKLRGVHCVDRVLCALAVILWCTALAGPVEARQHEGHQMAPARPAAKAEAAPQAEKILGWEPIRCWRQSTAGAITIGEIFKVVITCAVFEGDTAQVVPDESRLNVASIQMAPFEILGGSHPPDVHRAARRFFQYDYQLRVISRDAIGRDINIPPLAISYRIHSRVGAAATLEGRDLTYQMPMMPIKVLSLVPNDASDIRDASDASLAAVDSLRFQSSVFRVLTFTFGALAAAMVVLALVPLARSRAVVAATGPDRVPEGAVVRGAMADLADVQRRTAAEGWTADLVARAAAGARLIAAAAIDRPASQKLVTNGAVPEGRVLVRHGAFRPVKVSVSSPVTADDVARAVQHQDGLSTTRRQQLEGLQSALTTLTTALYRREPSLDGPALDEAVRQASSVGSEIARERSGWNRWARR